MNAIPSKLESPGLMTAVVLSGAAQLVLALGSLAIPRVLRWREELATLRPLTRQVFWVYAAYIWATNVSFGLLSALCPRQLLDGSALAGTVCGFIAAWWAARLVVQFTCFGRAGVPQGWFFRVAETSLVLLFVALVAVYGTAAAVTLDSRP